MNPSVFSYFNQTVRPRVLNGLSHYRGGGFPAVVLTDDSFQVQVCQDVAIEDHCGFTNNIFGKLVGSGCAHGLRLDCVLELYTVVRSIPEEMLNLVRLVRE